MPFSTSVLSFCPVSITLFLGTAALFTFYQKQRNLTTTTTTSTSTATTATTTTVVFVLGGPGAGKGTLCQLLSQRLGWIHLSAGDLLRAERIQKGPSAALIEQRISAGQLVPSEITVALLLAAMVGHEKVLVDGFPRSQENVDAWNDAILQKNKKNNSNIIVKLVLNLVCPEEVLVGRLLERGRTSGRQDDELSVIRKRFQTFQQESKPIVNLYKDKLVTIETDVAVEQVYNAIKPHVEYL